MLKFLHTADIHLDSAFTAHFTAEQAENMRSNIMTSFSRIIKLAESVDVLLISGDLFDNPNPSRATVSFVKRLFGGIPGTKIFIAAGNHDPYTPDSVYARENLGENVHVFGVEPECFELPELKTRIFGVSFSSVHCSEGLSLPEIEKRDGVYDILSVHADLVSNGARSEYNPIDKTVIASSGADYLALGHIHKRSDVLRCGDTYYAYPGIPQGRGFDECGDLGCYIGCFDGEVTDIKFEKIAAVRMFRLETDITGCSDGIHIAEKVSDAMKNLGGCGDFYRIILNGRIEPGIFSIDSLKYKLKDLASFLEIIDKTKPAYDIEEISKQNTLCGEFVRYMLSEVKNSADAERTEEAILLGVCALLGGDGV